MRVAAITISLNDEFQFKFLREGDKTSIDGSLIYLVSGNPCVAFTRHPPQAFRSISHIYVKYPLGMLQLWLI